MVFIWGLSVKDKGLISKLYKELKQLQSKKPQNYPVKTGQNFWTDIFPKKTYKWLAGSLKDLQLLGKYRSKSQWGIASRLLGWLLTKKQEITSAGEDVERKEKNGSFLVAMENSTEILQNLKLELPYDLASLIAQLVKNLLAMLETLVWFLGW